MREKTTPVISARISTVIKSSVTLNCPWVTTVICFRKVKLLGVSREQKEACIQVIPVPRIKLAKVLIAEIITIHSASPLPTYQGENDLTVTIIQVWKVESIFLEKYFMLSKRYGLGLSNLQILF